MSATNCCRSSASECCQRCDVYGNGKLEIRVLTACFTSPRPISDGELDVIPRQGGFPVSNPTRREKISMLEDLYRLGCNKRRLSSWLDPINTRNRRIFILACRKNQIKFVVGSDILKRILFHLYKAV